MLKTMERDVKCAVTVPISSINSKLVDKENLSYKVIDTVDTS